MKPGKTSLLGYNRALCSMDLSISLYLRYAKLFTLPTSNQRTINSAIEKGHHDEPGKKGLEVSRQRNMRHAAGRYTDGSA